MHLVIMIIFSTFLLLLFLHQWFPLRCRQLNALTHGLQPSSVAECALPQRGRLLTIGVTLSPADEHLLQEGHVHAGHQRLLAAVGAAIQFYGRAVVAPVSFGHAAVVHVLLL